MRASFLLAANPLLPSARWQEMICLAAALCLLFECWRGWRLGFIRGLLKFMALVTAWFAGSSMAAACNALGIVFFHQPSVLVPSITGVVAGILVYGLISFFAALFFKKTDHYHGFFRTFVALGGACCGLLFGLFFIWGGISAIRSLGFIGEMRLLHAKEQGLSSSSDPIACNLIRLQKSLELGSLGKWLIQIDPITSGFYENVRKSMLVIKDHEALLRFIAASSTQKLLANPRLYNILHDPQIQKAVDSGDLLLLAHNKNLQQALNDPALWRAIKSFDFSSALNEALRSTPQR